MISPRAATRRAVSLAELLVVMSACTVILTTSATLVHRAMHAHSRTRAYVDVERSLGRIAGQFRSDVHDAAAAIIDDRALGEDMLLRLEGPDRHTIEYRRTNDGVLRAVSRRDDRTAREEFLLPPQSKIAIREELSPRRLVLTIKTPRDATAAGDNQPQIHPHTPPAHLQVEAVLSRNRRFAPAAASTEEPQ